MEEPHKSGEEGAISPEGDEWSHRRASPRDSMFLSANLHNPRSDESWQVRVRNISAGGLMADCVGEFQPGEEVQVELRPIGVIKARVAWAGDGRVGLSFATRIDPLQLRRPIGVRPGRR